MPSSCTRFLDALLGKPNVVAWPIRRQALLDKFVWYLGPEIDAPSPIHRRPIKGAELTCSIGR
jgi:hypothetical protein